MKNFKVLKLTAAAVLMSVVFGAFVPDNGCPAVDPLDHTVLLPYPDDCHKFWMCIDGIAIEENCPEDLCFDPTINVCDWCELIPNCNGNGSLWKRTDEDCTYTVVGDAGAQVTILGVTITLGANGIASYTYPGGRTKCEQGGKEQCEARYCPPM